MSSLIDWLVALPLWWRIALVPIYVGSIVLTAELCHRWQRLPAEQTRKIVHIGTGNVILMAWVLQLPAWVGITSAILSGIAAVVSYQFPILPGVNSVGRKSLGTFFYAVSIGLNTAIFWPLQQPAFAVLGILVMAWGDGLAAIIGQQFGRHPYQIWGNKKSWEGSGTLALVTYIISTVIFYNIQVEQPFLWWVGIPIALAAVGLESFSQWGVDNLTLPIGVAILSYLLFFLH